MVSHTHLRLYDQKKTTKRLLFKTFFFKPDLFNVDPVITVIQATQQDKGRQTANQQKKGKEIKTPRPKRTSTQSRTAAFPRQAVSDADASTREVTASDADRGTREVVASDADGARREGTARTGGMEQRGSQRSVTTRRGFPVPCSIYRRQVVVLQTT